MPDLMTQEEAQVAEAEALTNSLTALCDQINSGFQLGNEWGPQISQADTMFDNCRWYLISNLRQLLSQIYVEHGIVQTFTRDEIPPNLTIRISATMVDGAPTAHWPTTSTVHKIAPPKGQVCPAPTQGNKCADCRACWSCDVTNVSYHQH